MLVVFFGFVAAARAQTSPPPQPPRERPPLGAAVTVGPLGALPAAGNLFSLLDTLVPDVIADRIDAGGISAGSPARVGAHGSTWTQTIFRVGDADITSLSGTGAPLLMPGVDVWEYVDVATGLMPLDVSAPGLAVTLTPRRPGGSWTRSLQLIGAPPAFTGGSASASPPTITRLGSFGHANVFMSGPIVQDKLGALVSANWIRSSYYERDNPTALQASLGSAFVNLTATPTSSDEIRLIGWGQRTRDAAPNHFLFNQPAAGQRNLGMHGQAAWQHALAGWRRRRSRVRRLHAGTTHERSRRSAIRDRRAAERRPGARAGRRRASAADRTWSAGVAPEPIRAARIRCSPASMSRAEARRRSRCSPAASASSSTGWRRASGTSPTLSPNHVWRQRSFAAFVGDTFAVARRLTINGGLRFEGITRLRGGPRRDDHGGATCCRAPASTGRCTISGSSPRSASTAATPTGCRSPTSAYGDPTAPTANVSRWTVPAGRPPTPGTLAGQTAGPVVQRLGPGSAGVASFSTIDPALKRPSMDELVLGFEARPRQNTFLRIAAIGRRDNSLVGVVNVGVPLSTYSIIGVPDMGIDTVGSGDDQTPPLLQPIAGDVRGRPLPADQPVGPRRVVRRRRHDRHGATGSATSSSGD